MEKKKKRKYCLLVQCRMPSLLSLALPVHMVEQQEPMSTKNGSDVNGPSRAISQIHF